MAVFGSVCLFIGKFNFYIFFGIQLSQTKVIAIVWDNKNQLVGAKFHDNKQNLSTFSGISTIETDLEPLEHNEFAQSLKK